MTSYKNIILGLLIVAIVGAIFYLESMKVHPAGSGASGAVQAIGINPAVPSPAASGTLSLQAASGTPSSGAGVSPNVSVSLAAVAAADQKAGYQPAIEIADPTGFINVSSSFTLGSLVGKKVILLDFWTYSCINCIRTLPYLTAWYSKYKDQGLEIVGIHTPEFDFEKDINNVEAAAVKYGITYPIVLDSNYGTWQAYNNLYWPHEYLIDIAGYIVHDHVGEGDYAETEGVIQQLLKQREEVLGTGQAVATSTVNVKPADLSDIQSPETYFGAERNQYLANGAPMQQGTQTLALPAGQPGLNQLYLGGTWNFEDQYATNVDGGATILYQYDADKVYIVASAAANGATLDVMQDGKPVTAAIAGADVQNGKVHITGSRLYSLIANPSGGVHTLEITVENPGLQAFTFTFG